MSSKAEASSYHHGDLRNALLEAARTILEEEGLAALSLRAVARRAGVSHAAPYRHFANHEALLVELATEGFIELRADIAGSVDTQDGVPIALPDRRGLYALCCKAPCGCAADVWTAASQS